MWWVGKLRVLLLAEAEHVETMGQTFEDSTAHSLSSCLVGEVGLVMEKSQLCMEKLQRSKLFQIPAVVSDSLPIALDFPGPFHFPLSSCPSALTSSADLCSMYPENLGNMEFAAFPMSTLVFISSMNSSRLMKHVFPFQKPQCHYLTPCLPSFPALQGLHK